MSILRILLITGKQAEEIIRKIVASTSTKHNVDILALPVSVIALVSTDFIARQLARQGIKKEDYDLIIIPGLCRGSAKVIEETTGIKAVKGTLYAADLPLILSMEDPGKLSPDKPADDIIKDLVIERNRNILRELEEKLAKNPGSHIKVGSVTVPRSPPPIRVMAEVSDCHLLNREEILKKIQKLVSSGADIISIGFEAGNPRPDRVYEVVKFLKKEISTPIAIDSIIPSEIKSALKAGVDMVLSIEAGNVDKVADYLGETPYVAIPYDSSRNYIPGEPMERIELLEYVIKKAHGHNAVNTIGDLILDPPIVGKTLGSLAAYMEFKKRYPSIPLMMGIGNVSELMDVDTVGVNALLVMLGLEAGVSIMLVVEKSVKAQGSTLETKIASQMASLAYMRKSPPKDLGIDLLILKDKRRIDMSIDTANAKVVDAVEEKKEYKLDPMGFFKIRVNHEAETIEALYAGRKGKILIRGKTARAIRDYILEQELVSTLSHAFYLGIELGKAEEALTIHKNYYQEKPLFTRKKPLNI